MQTQLDQLRVQHTFTSLEPVTQTTSSEQQQQQQQLNSSDIPNTCSSSSSSTISFFMLTILVGIYELIAHLVSVFTSILPGNIFKITKSHCEKHGKTDARMDCKLCQKSEKLPQQVYNDLDCAICLQPIKHKVFYSCKHSSCAECTVEYWEKTNFKRIRCFFCRQPIDMIYRDFKARSDESLLRLRASIRSYNTTFAPKDRSFFSKIRESPLLLHRTVKFMCTHEGIAYILGHVCSSHYFVVGILYIISPLDLLPECIFGIFGLLDDLVVMGILFVLLTNFYYRYLLRQDRDNAQQEDD